MKALLSKLSRKQSGFTIIEVMIVLALAGLIIAAVIVAVPQLQRNQRNSARRSILGRVATEINNYVGNNNGVVPDGSAAVTTGFVNGFVPRYISGPATAESFFSPKTGASMSYSATTTAGGASIAEDAIVYVPGALCNGETPTTTAASTTRSFAVAIGLEGGASYCLDNK